ncbi:MAG: aromatic ring-hydroxylating dioxygenase subunit alpha [Thaumarchaeota archaeon]|nr:aromatic ring-hydroxylating dioxygenase subunit alpha [Nitrososphaerota archaeon]
MIRDPVLQNDWHPLAKSEDVREDIVIGGRLLGEDLAIWRCGGEVLVWKDLCMHRGTRLSLGWIDGKTLVCAYHGWTYDSTGRCVRMPAHSDQKPPEKAQVTVYKSKEEYGLVWASLGDPAMSVPPFPEWGNREYRKILCGPYSYSASAPRAIENALDVAHFPFVHEGLLGDRKHTEIEDYEVETGPNGIVAKDIRVWQPDPDGTGIGASVSYTYRVFRPLSMHFSKSSGAKNFAIFFTVCPVEERKSIAWLWIAMDYGNDQSADELRAFQDKVTMQDVPIVESQRPELLPLDLQAELHLRSDRTSIAYRKWLRELGVSFGTA